MAAIGHPHDRIAGDNTVHREFAAASQVSNSMRDAFVVRTRTSLLGILFLLPSVLAPATGLAGESTLVLGCRHDARDEILAIICRRVEAETAGVAQAAGFSLEISGESLGVKPLEKGNRSLEIRLTATQPDSQFGQKRIDANLVGRFAIANAPPWEVDLTAEGVPRDLVHPVADALLGRVEAFLATVAPQ